MQCWEMALSTAALSLSGGVPNDHLQRTNAALLQCGVDVARQQPFLRGCRSVLKRAMTVSALALRRLMSWQFWGAWRNESETN